MSVTISQSEISGTIHAPPSKSYTHRAIVCGLLSSGGTTIKNPLICDDTSATIQLSRMMGAQIDENRDLKITGPENLQAPEEEMYCSGSGTTLRLFTAISALAYGRCVLTGDENLRKRPIRELLEALHQLGIRTSTHFANDRPPVEVQASGLIGGTTKIRGDISSQYISGLLFACSKGLKNSRIELLTKLESIPYVEMTLEVMKHFGVTASVSNDWESITIEGNQRYHNSAYEIPGDYSSAAFLMVSGALAGSVSITGLNKNSLQGDARIISILKEMGVEVQQDNSIVSVFKSEPKATEIDATNIPDLVPILAVLASQAKGQTRIINAERLRYKESNRLMTTSMELRKMGAKIKETTNGLIIDGPTKLHGATINPHSDHRIAMACAVACLVSKQFGIVSKHYTTINDIDCVKKSYPEFIANMKSLGAQIEFSERGGN